MLTVLFLMLILGIPGIDSFQKAAVSFHRLSRKLQQSSRSSVIEDQSMTDSDWKAITKDGGIKKLILKQASSSPFAQRVLEAGDILAIDYSAKLEGADQPFATASQAKFVFQDGTMIKGWDLAVGSMKVGETARFVVSGSYGYGERGVAGVIPSNANLEFEISLLGWLGNQMKPETMFKSDLQLDPFLATTPEQIQRDFTAKQRQQTKAIEERFQGNMLEIYWRRIRNMSVGFAGSSFFRSTSGAASPWYLNPLITFPSMALVLITAFLAVVGLGGVREKGVVSSDLDPLILTNTNTVLTNTNPHSNITPSSPR